MINLKSILKTTKAILVILYAIFLLLLIPAFFFNYNGEWMKNLARDLPIKEMNSDNSH